MGFPKVISFYCKKCKKYSTVKGWSESAPPCWNHDPERVCPNCGASGSDLVDD